MTSIKALQDLCQWELKKGSHDWPGPDGGTCINEAALVVAGFEYCAIEDISDFPPCFSRVLGWYLLLLNDNFDDANRQKLKRFILRLAGSADNDCIECERFELIKKRLRSILGPVPQYTGLHATDYAIAVSLGAVLLSPRTNKYADGLIAVAEDAFAIGKQAEPLDEALVQERIAKAKALAKEKVTV